MAKHKKERSTNNAIGLKINEVMRAKGMVGDYSAVATHFRVAVPSVYGWVDTGRIHKDRLNTLSIWSGRPVTWWLDTPGAGDTGSYEPLYERALMSALDLAPSLNVNDVMDELKFLAGTKSLQIEDWFLLLITARRLAVKTNYVGLTATPKTDPQDLPLEITAEAQEAIDNRVREAQQRREQNQQQGHRPAKNRAA
jgi:hypothetical protein